MDKLFAHASAVLRCAELTRAVALVINVALFEGQALLAPLLRFISVSVAIDIVVLQLLLLLLLLLLWNYQIPSRLWKLMVLLMFEMMNARLLWLMR